MAKYLFQASYTTEGLKGLFKDGGTKRREALQSAVAQLGGSLESIYYAFGQDDVFSVVSLPDNVSAASVALTIGASGTANVKRVVLMTPEEIDDATKKKIEFRPSGQSM